MRLLREKAGMVVVGWNQFGGLLGVSWSRSRCAPISGVFEGVEDEP